MVVCKVYSALDSSKQLISHLWQFSGHKTRNSVLPHPYQWSPEEHAPQKYVNNFTIGIIINKSSPEHPQQPQELDHCQQRYQKPYQDAGHTHQLNLQPCSTYYSSTTFQKTFNTLTPPLQPSPEHRVRESRRKSLDNLRHDHLLLHWVSWTRSAR